MLSRRQLLYHSTLFFICQLFFKKNLKKFRLFLQSSLILLTARASFAVARTLHGGFSRLREYFTRIATLRLAAASGAENGIVEFFYELVKFFAADGAFVLQKGHYFSPLLFFLIVLGALVRTELVYRVR